MLGSKSKTTRTSSEETAAVASSFGGDSVVLQSGRDLTVQGSNISAGNNAVLIADGAITLAAAQNTYDLHSTNSSKSAGIGVALSVGANGIGAGITANAAVGRGQADGRDVQHTNTRISAGNVAVLDSGGDTTLKGAVVSGEQVIAKVGGDLNIQSLQDTSTYKSRDKNVGGSVTVGIGFSASVQAGQSKVDGDYASVVEQSGIQSGDGGFQVQVKGNTDLKGGVIASSAQAIQDNKNRGNLKARARTDRATDRPPLPRRPRRHELFAVVEKRAEPADCCFLRGRWSEGRTQRRFRSVARPPRSGWGRSNPACIRLHMIDLPRCRRHDGGGSWMFRKSRAGGST